MGRIGRCDNEDVSLMKLVGEPGNRRRGNMNIVCG